MTAQELSSEGVESSPGNVFGLFIRTSRKFLHVDEYYGETDYQ